MPASIVVGLGWGDEGKGKVVDFFSKDARHVVRAQGGNNAGHTVKIGSRQYALHLVPSGILSPNTYCYIGGGVVVDPEGILKEIESLESAGIEVQGRLFISPYAHVVLPYHKEIDRQTEAILSGGAIGTTGRGIGPCYMDAVGRFGIRMCDFIGDSFEALFREALALKRKMLSSQFSLSEEIGPYLEYAQKLKSFVTPFEQSIDRAILLGETVLFEGAQGVLLDATFGTYPFVTSSHTVSGGVLAGAGIGPTRIGRVIGVLKAYATRVGNGPFPTEEDALFADKKSIGEVGTTTGRQRRVGHFDGVLSKSAVKLTGTTSVALTKLDVLSSLDELKICCGYEIDGEYTDIPPASLTGWKKAVPKYETMPGWKVPIDHLQTIHQLPKEARKYIERIEETIEAPVDIVSIGPERSQTIVLNQEI